MRVDLFPTRVVVIALAIVVVGGLAAITFLAATQTPIPDALDRLVFTALGSLGTLLAKTAVESRREVEVANGPDRPVPVDAGQVSALGLVVILLVVILLVVLL